MPFEIGKYSDTYKSINEARDKLAKEAVSYVHKQCSDEATKKLKSSQVLKGASAMKTVKDNGWMQELKNVLGDKEGYDLSKDNYIITESQEHPVQFVCKFVHPKLEPIESEWGKSKQEAKQSAAKKVLEYYYEKIKKQ